MELVIQIGTVAGFILPFFNIPLILRIMKRKSSDDISMTWVIGVWVCILLMTPVSLMSKDLAFRLFGITNVIFFSAVVWVTARYHKRSG